MTDHHALALDGGVEVTQADREAAILVCRQTGWTGVARRLEQGWTPEPGTSEANLIEAFARHRLAALATQQPSAAGRDTNCDESGRGDLNRALYKVLRDFHVSNMAGEDGMTGFPLVDLVSNDGCGIDTGEEQLRDLADELTGAALARPQWDAGVARLREAARAVLDRMFGTYRARNGRQVGIESDDGEKCWIVHSDDIENLRRAVDALTTTSGENAGAGDATLTTTTAKSEVAK